LLPPSREEPGAAPAGRRTLVRAGLIFQAFTDVMTLEVF
jgi:hypothetical protein